jgi:very-short-patch-repair endonuclease
LKNLHDRQSWRKKGRRRLEDALARLDGDRAPLSNWSSWASERLRAHGLPRPLLEHRFTRPDGTLIAQVDLFWPEARLVVELDGRTFHSSPAQMATDRRRDANLAALGVVVLRFTWEQYNDGDYFVDAIKRVFHLRVA